MYRQGAGRGGAMGAKSPYWNQNQPNKERYFLNWWDDDLKGINVK